LLLESCSRAFSRMILSLTQATCYNLVEGGFKGLNDAVGFDYIEYM